MGNEQAKLSPEELRELEDSTYFDKRELQKWFREFMKDCPSGSLSKDDFIRIYQQFFPQGNPSQFATHVFKVFDSNSDGCISFKEFIVALSVTSKGSLDEKLDWAFSLYDLDGDGYISSAEMLSIVTSIYEMVGNMLILPKDEDTPQKRVRKIFMQMDQDNDGRLTRQEFKDGSKMDPFIVQALSIDYDQNKIEPKKS
ncbi:neuronal calcium sensor 1-like [Bolinopsis microptera]|uniref:neuronal calcium sensor 1-like n=1 Tax=Bolinopsis microptera TaxID=2820187 RepID=UPI0030795571